MQSHGRVLPVVRTCCVQSLINVTEAPAHSLCTTVTPLTTLGYLLPVHSP